MTDYSAISEGGVVDCKTSRFRFRLRFRTAKAFDCELASRKFDYRDHEVELKSQVPAEPIKAARWLVATSGGFSSADAARTFAEQFQEALTLTGLCCFQGFDFGQGKATSHVNEGFARSAGLVATNERLEPNVHGVSVFPDDDLTRIAVIEATASVSLSLDLVVNALRETAVARDLRSWRGQKTMWLLSHSLLAKEPLAQMVLALAAVEEMGQSESWTNSQLSLLHHLASLARVSSSCSETERIEVADAITRSYRMGLRQGVFRLLERLQLSLLRKEWNRLYDVRSNVFHGRSQMPQNEMAQAAFDTQKMCIRVLIAVAKQDGIVLPGIVHQNFDVM